MQQVCLEALAANPTAATADVHNIQTAMNYRAAIHHIDIGGAQRRFLHTASRPHVFRRRRPGSARARAHKLSIKARAALSLFLSAENFPHDKCPAPCFFSSLLMSFFGSAGQESATEFGFVWTISGVRGKLI